MDREDQRGVPGNPQVLATDANTLLCQLVDFAVQGQGSITTPLPMTESLPGRTMRRGSSESL